jgi:hypothetical protein
VNGPAIGAAIPCLLMIRCTYASAALVLSPVPEPHICPLDSVAFPSLLLAAHQSLAMEEWKEESGRQEPLPGVLLGLALINQSMISRIAAHLPGDLNKLDTFLARHQT